MGGVFLIWVVFVKCGGGLSYVGGVCQIWAPIHYGTVMKYVANNDHIGFVIKICHIWGVSQI